MKQKYDHAEVCALCEHCCHVEYDGRYLCKYKSRCFIVDETGSCRHFRFDLLKLEPTPKLPYQAEDVDVIELSAVKTK